MSTFNGFSREDFGFIPEAPRPELDPNRLKPDPVILAEYTELYPYIERSMYHDVATGVERTTSRQPILMAARRWLRDVKLPSKEESIRKMKENLSDD